MIKALAIAAALVATPVHAADSLDTTMRSLMTWASPATGYPVPDTVPRVRFADRCDIEAFVYPDSTSDCDTDGSGVQAAYEHHSKTIYLQTGWSADSLFDVSALLHELIHHMQNEAGLTIDTVECPPRDLEKPAYDAQIAWINATGEDAYEVIGMNGLFYVMITSCDFFGGGAGHEHGR